MIDNKIYRIHHKSGAWEGLHVMILLDMFIYLYDFF